MQTAWREPHCRWHCSATESCRSRIPQSQAVWADVQGRACPAAACMEIKTGLPGTYAINIIPNPITNAL